MLKKNYEFIERLVNGKGVREFMVNKEQMQKCENGVDFDRLTAVAITHKAKLGCIILGCTLIATGISFVLPKQYDSTTVVQIRSAGQEIGSGSAAVASMFGISSKAVSLPSSYIELMKSRHVLEPIINDIDWGDEKRKPTAEAFAKAYLEIKNVKQTNIITITAKGKTPEDAQKVANDVVDNFLLMQTDLNQQTQSLLGKFLEDRIDVAKEEAEEARVRFATYQQEHKIYSPDKQAKDAVSKLNAFDEALGQMEVQQKSNQAKLDAVETKLGDIRSSSQRYNINDNESIVELRKKIVDAQINLVGLREHYTEEHPSVLSARRKIESLQNKLTEEVNTLVASRYTTINPTQATLIGEQANAEVGLAIANASAAAIRERKAEKEKELDGFPKDVLDYMNLQREATIKEQVYTTLIKQAEDNKLKEAMRSMDVQVIDSADLKEEPCAPRKKVIAAIGFIIGCVISIVTLLLIMKREEKSL